MDAVMTSLDHSVSKDQAPIPGVQQVVQDSRPVPRSDAGDDSDIGVETGKAKSENDKDSQDYYFQYYASLQNQANMIGDTARTNAYRKAIQGNSLVAFKDKLVIDVGAGSGILSFFAAKAGAKSIKAIEASNMAKKMQLIITHSKSTPPSDPNSPFPPTVTNPHLRDVPIEVLHGKVEDEGIQKRALREGRVDTIVSEPIGVMLFHERMVESFLLARDLFLKPSGSLFPSMGTLHFQPFSDEALYVETETKAAFFDQTLFGTDFSCLVQLAREEAFAQPIVGLIPPTTLVGQSIAPRVFDFYTMAVEELLEFELDLDWVVPKTCLLNGVATWFDLGFGPPPNQVVLDDELNASIREQWDAAANAGSDWAWMGGAETSMNPPELPHPPLDGVNVVLSTGPYSTRTHWQQCRLLLPEPLAVNRGERVTGKIRFTANESRSYDLVLDLYLDRAIGSSGDENYRIHRQGKYNLAQQHFNYSYTGEVGVAGGYAA